MDFKDNEYSFQKNIIRMQNEFQQEYIRLSKSLHDSIFAPLKAPSISFFDDYENHLQNLSENTKKALTTLGNYGWYIPSLNHPVSFPTRIAKELLNGNEEYVDYQMRLLIKSEFSSLCKQLINTNPHRSRILKDAFKAHRKKKYSLSVPVFLSQTDGICKEITGVSLFLKENKSPKTKEYIENIKRNHFLMSFLEPLRIVLPIIYSDKDINEDIKFNRHKILHGENFNYNNETISLKAFSLLSYVNTFLRK
jgi:hypothetical protein